MKSQAKLPSSAREWPPIPLEIVEILERLYPPIGTDTRTIDRPVIDFTQGACSVAQKIRRVYEEQRSQ